MPGRLRLVVLLATLLGVSSLSSLGAVAAADSDVAESEIPYLPSLRPQVEFLKQIFAVYSSREVLIHDSEHLDRIYSVLDFRPLAESGVSDAEFEAYRKSAVAEEKERIRAILVGLHQTGPDAADLSPEEKHIAALFDEERGSSKFLAAAEEDRVRSQTGLRERFAAGVETSRRYLPEMEAIFRREGLQIGRASCRERV